jgi:hypothetical protein
MGELLRHYKFHSEITKIINIHKITITKIQWVYIISIFYSKYAIYTIILVKIKILNFIKYKFDNYKSL